jgi:hypothetical protein
MYGRIIWTHTGTFAAGKHLIPLSKDDLGTAGYYFVTLEAGNRRSMCKLVALGD